MAFVFNPFTGKLSPTGDAAGGGLTEGNILLFSATAAVVI